jgi:SAM-dependent methyltransferase
MPRLRFRHLLVAATTLVVCATWTTALAHQHSAQRALAWQQEGADLYWLLRRTYRDNRPLKLVDQLVRRHDRREAVLELLAIQPGEVVADIGCGAGYYSFELARQAGAEGRVLAVDIDPAAVAFLGERSARVPCPGCAPIEARVSQVDAAGLAPGSVDAALVASLNFYAYRPLLPENLAMLDSVYEGLRPGGRAVVTLDLPFTPGGSPENMRQSFEDAGFEAVEQHAHGDSSVVHVFRRPR